MDFILRKLYHVCFVPLPTFKHNPTQVLIESDLDETTSVHHLKSHFFHLRGIPTDCLEICCDEGGGFHRAMWMEGCTTLNVWYWPRELLQLGPCYVKFEGSGSGNIYIYIYNIEKYMTTCFSKAVTWLKIVQSCGFIDIISHLLRLVTCDTNQAKCCRMGNYFMALALILDIFHWISLFVWRGFPRTLVTGQHVGFVGVIWGFLGCWECKDSELPQIGSTIVLKITAALHHVIGIYLYTEIQHGLVFGEETHLSLWLHYFTMSCKVFQIL